VARATGGGARSSLWLRIVASALELPIERLEVEEGAAFGAALLGGVAGGVWEDVDAAIAASVRVRDVIDPEPAWIPAQRQLQERFRALYPKVGAGGGRVETVPAPSRDRLRA
jgi:xylulokinase